MIKERYVSFTLAMKLREKGFDERTKGHYSLKESSFKEFKYWEGEGYRNSKWPYPLSAPTHQMVIEWLREKHLIFISVKPRLVEGDIIYRSEIDILNHGYIVTAVSFEDKSYNKACIKAIDYAVNTFL